MGLVTGSDCDIEKKLNKELLTMGLQGEGLVDKRVMVVKTHYPERYGKTKFYSEKCILEVSDFAEAVQMSAQTALLESIGRHQLSQMITEREMLGKELQRILDSKTNPWGITVQSVEIRDVYIPAALEDAMSRQAQAERERQARIVLGTAETEISAKFAEAALVYQDNPIALHLRAMNMLYEAIKEKGAMVIVPSSAVETMGLGGMLATSTLGKAPGPLGTPPLQ